MRSAATVRVGNCSGFYGDRLSAMREMLEGGELDFLTGDYLAELTMLILGRDRAKDDKIGYARTFLAQLKDCLKLALDKRVTIVSNAGGVNPAGLVDAIRELGLPAEIALVRGDDLTARAGELGLGHPLGAHAYLGAFGIARAIESGADLVVTGRVTDASLVIGPAIARFGWSRADLDALAGATVAGHLLECGTQSTGGNYAFFGEIADPLRPGFPIAEIEPDGTCVITKHPGTGGAVTVGTVTAQLVYEVGDARYPGPDVTTRLDTVELAATGPDRVRVSGVRGEPPPPDLKVSRTALGGFRNELTVVLTGLDIEAKAALFRRQFEAAAGPSPAEVTWTLARLDRPDASTEQAASALLTVVARDPDERVAGRAFVNPAIELALGSYPGFFATSPPGPAHPYGVFTAGFVPQAAVSHEVVLPGGTVVPIAPPESTRPLEPLPGAAPDATGGTTVPTRRLPLGTIVGARSGDKGGSANVGLWVHTQRGDSSPPDDPNSPHEAHTQRGDSGPPDDPNPPHEAHTQRGDSSPPDDPDSPHEAHTQRGDFGSARADRAYGWLAGLVTERAIRALLPEAADLPIRIAYLPNLRAVNVVIDGLLGEGVAYHARFDPQAKGLGEWLRSRLVDIPVSLLEDHQ